LSPRLPVYLYAFLFFQHLGQVTEVETKILLIGQRDRPLSFKRKTRQEGRPRLPLRTSTGPSFLTLFLILFIRLTEMLNAVEASPVRQPPIQ
jgi:hypothetical protein